MKRKAHLTEYMDIILSMLEKSPSKELPSDIVEKIAEKTNSTTQAVKVQRKKRKEKRKKRKKKKEKRKKEKGKKKENESEKEKEIEKKPFSENHPFGF